MGVKFLVSLALLLSINISATLAASTTIGSTAAVRCYRESLFPLSQQGIKYCDEAISRGKLNLRDLAATYSNRGIIHLKNGNIEEALEDHDKAVKLKPDLPQVHINRGNVFYHSHDYEEALAEFNTAIMTSAGPMSTAFLNKALTLIKLQRIDDATKTLQKALELLPDSEQIRQRLQKIAEFKSSQQRQL